MVLNGLVRTTCLSAPACYSASLVKVPRYAKRWIFNPGSNHGKMRAVRIYADSSFFRHPGPPPPQDPIPSKNLTVSLDSHFQSCAESLPNLTIGLGQSFEGGINCCIFLHHMLQTELQLVESNAEVILRCLCYIVLAHRTIS